MKLIHEGKAFKNNHGDWLVHEGESLEQAKARVEDKELLQQLLQQAIEDYKEEFKLREQEEARIIAEEDARFTEEEQQEAETEAQKLKERT